MKLPTKIILPPETIKKTNSTGRGQLHFYCDDKKWYSGNELASTLGIRWKTLRERLRRHSWRKKGILHCDTNNEVIGIELEIKEGELSGLWKKLGVNARDKNLDKIKTGTFENGVY